MEIHNWQMAQILIFNHKVARSGFYGWLVSQGMLSLDRAPYVGIVAAVGYAALAGALASVIEAVTPGDFDNIAIPIIIAVVLVGLGL